MKIIFSRHAKRRMQLYKIEKKDVVEIVENYIADKVSALGKQEVVNKEMEKKYNFPLKIVFSKENDKTIIITVYPLRKERKLWKYIMIKKLMLLI